MAILESEKRPRGLRLPSLSAMKSRKKSSEPSPPDSPDFAPIPPASGVPVRPARPHDKQLPPNPMLYPQADSIPAPPPDVSTNPNEYHRQIMGSDLLANSYPRPQVPVQRKPAPPPSQPPPQSQSYFPPQPPVQVPRVQSPPTIQVPVQQPQPIHPVQAPSLRSPIQSPPDSDGETKDDLPLEDFIPEPESDSDTAVAGAGTRTNGVAVADETPTSSSDENDNSGPWTPPDYEPIAAPLDKLHYACYQGHKSMPVANNQWYPLPCMTCQKYDHEIRHRCVFCSLRICAECYQGLQKCRNRSLAELMESLP